MQKFVTEQKICVVRQQRLMLAVAERENSGCCILINTNVVCDHKFVLL